jgi:FMN phosphatase YigB (HAD superfamily)
VTEPTKRTGLTEPRVVLFDFGDTLADQEWMQVGLASLSEAAESYDRWVRRDREVWSAWRRGDMCAEDIADLLARHVGASAGVLLDRFRRACQDVTFDDGMLRLAERLRIRGVATAIVTLNADVFSRFVVPEYALDTRFDAVINSSDEGTLDKAAMCASAAARLGARPHDALLIDDSAEHRAGFQMLGGRAVHYRTLRGRTDHRCLSAVVDAAIFGRGVQ